jgi:hypothetical protein
MARQGPRGGGKTTASIRLQVWGHDLLSNTLDAMDKEIEFDRAGASFRRRRKRAPTDQILPSFMPTSAKSVVEAATILLLAFSIIVIFGLVFCAPTLPAASFQQARECRGLVISRTSPISADGALRRGTSAIILEAAGSGDAPNATSLGRSSIGAGMHVVPRTSASTQIYTPTHRMRHHKQPTSLDLHQQLFLLDAEPPITASSRPHVRLHRSASSSLPASLRPAAPPACRPTCPGRLARTRPLLCRAAQRLHASKPCHAGSHGTRQKYFRKNSNKKTANLGCNNALEEPDGYACASASCMAPALPSRPSLRTSSRPSSRAPSRTSPGASAVHQQTASPLTRAGLKTALNVIHA